MVMMVNPLLEFIPIEVDGLDTLEPPVWGDGGFVYGLL
jgi:hypothetical protein